MAFSISEFTGAINKHGLAKNNLFVFKIMLPNGLAGAIGESSNMTARELVFLCKSAEMPEIAVQTQDFKPRGYGPSEKRPTGFELPLLPTVFMVDSNFAVLKFFHKWMQQIVNYDVDAGYTSEVEGARPYEFGYRDDYACTIEVTVYSGNQTDKTYTYKFYNAYPTTIGSQGVSWENGAEVMTLPIQFAYDSIKVEATTTGKTTGDFGSANGLLSYLSAINTFGQALNNLNRPRNLQDVVNTVTDVNTILGALK